jgi:hypothetical protein
MQHPGSLIYGLPTGSFFASIHLRNRKALGGRWNEHLPSLTLIGRTKVVSATNHKQALPRLRRFLAHHLPETRFFHLGRIIVMAISAYFLPARTSLLRVELRVI